MDQTSSYIGQLGQETRNILLTITELVYYMRGGLSRTEALEMSAGEREIVADFINKRMKDAKDDSRTVIAI